MSGKKVFSTKPNNSPGANDRPGPENPEASLSLWDQACDSLKQDQSEILSKYEDLLSRVPTKAKPNNLSAPEQVNDASAVNNCIPENDPATRRERLKQIIELGLKHVEDKKVKVTILGHTIKLEDGIDKVGGAVKWAQDYVKNAIKDVPYAPAVMAGISLILPLLRIPATVKAANQEGLIYVTSQMRYYAEMESLLLAQDMKPRLRSDLSERVIGLYKSIINFQLRSVLRLYRRRTKNYFRDVINYDGWEGELTQLQAQEAEIYKEFLLVLSATSVEQLKKLATDAKESRKMLSDILQNIEKQMQELFSIAQNIEKGLSRAERERFQQILRPTNPVADKLRIEEEKRGLLKNVYQWVLDQDAFQQWKNTDCAQLLWIKGDPGKGKTMLMCGIINELEKANNGTNIAYFFFQAGDTRVNNATAVLRALIYRLVEQQPLLMTHISNSTFDNENAWYELRSIFFDMLGNSKLQETYLLIDALDECTTDLNRLLELLVKTSSTYSRVKWVVSSRNWPSIENELDRTTGIKLQLEQNEDNLSLALDSFINHKIDLLDKKNRYSQEMRKTVRDHLALNAQGTFLWVALVSKQLETVKERNLKEKLKSFPPGLDGVYQRMLGMIDTTNDSKRCRSLLEVVITVYRPITLDELPEYLELDDTPSDDQLRDIIKNCGSFLTLRDRTITLVDQSAQDFLQKEMFQNINLNRVQEVHYSIFSRSLGLLKKTHRNMYNIGDPALSISQIRRPDQDPLAALRYACVYWIDHLNDYFNGNTTNQQLGDFSLIDTFLCNDLLHWLEALSLLESLAEGARSMLRLGELLKKRTTNLKLINRVQDAYRFIIYHKTMIEDHPLQVYTSAIFFTPRSSMTRTQYESEELKWMNAKSMIGESWSACLQTLEGHSDCVRSVVFSPGSKQLASASDDRTIKLWDIASGACLQTLEGHSDCVRSVVFPPHSKQLASASDDMTIKLWDASSGTCLQTLEGHRGCVNSVDFSPDCKQLASASDDRAIKLWDTASGACLQTLEAHRGCVNSVAFSPDCRQLASASDDRTIKLWDAASGACLQTLEGHRGCVGSVVFSPDFKQLASASDDRTIKLWDTASGACLQTLEGHRSCIRSVVFSPDSKQLASASDDRTIKLWHASSGTCLQTLEGHSSWVNSVVFSPDSKQLTSGSHDRTIKLWDASSGTCWQTLEGHSSWVNSVVVSPDSKQLASASHDRTIKLWDASSGTCLQTLEGHSSSVNSVAFSPDSKQLASASSDTTIKLWDATSGACLQMFELHGGWVTEHDLGVFILNYLANLPSSQANPEKLYSHGFGISSDETWITWNSVKLLKLPSTFKISAFAVSPSTICIGFYSGHVHILSCDSH